MSTRYSAIVTNNDTDAHFRLWINEFHSAIIAAGWVQTSDTGQINFSTVTHPTNTNIFPGYAVYRMNDGYQATAPVYLRIDFGAGGGTANSPAIKARIGTSTDGAGSLTGACTSIQQSAGNSAYTSTVGVWSAGSTSSFRISMGTDLVTNAGFMLAIERDKDFYGNDTPYGVSLLHTYSASNTATPNLQFLEFPSGAQSSVDTKWWSLVHAGTSQSGGIGVIRPQLGRFRNPLKTIVIAAAGDYESLTQVSLNIYGVKRTFVMIPPCAGTGNNLNGLNSACKVGFLWE